MVVGAAVYVANVRGGGGQGAPTGGRVIGRRQQKQVRQRQHCIEII